MGILLALHGDNCEFFWRDRNAVLDSQIEDLLVPILAYGSPIGPMLNRALSTPEQSCETGLAAKLCNDALRRIHG